VITPNRTKTCTKTKTVANDSSNKAQMILQRKRALRSTARLSRVLLETEWSQPNQAKRTRAKRKKTFFHPLTSRIRFHHVRPREKGPTLPLAVTEGCCLGAYGGNTGELEILARGIVRLQALYKGQHARIKFRKKRSLFVLSFLSKGCVKCNVCMACEQLGMQRTEKAWPVRLPKRRKTTSITCDSSPRHGINPLRT